MNRLSLKSRLTFFIATILIAITIILTTFTLITIEEIIIKPQIETIGIITFMNREGILIESETMGILAEDDRIYYYKEAEEIEETGHGHGMGKGMGQRRRRLMSENTHHLSNLDLGMIEKGVVISDIKTAQTKVSKISILVMLGIIIFGVLGVYLMIERALKPLKELSGTIHEIGEDNLNTQIEVPKTDDEVSSLIVSFNKMLSRLEVMFKEQKNFSAKAAHELKTPLTTMKTSLQVLQMDEEPPLNEYRDNVYLMENNIDRLIDTVNNLFLLSSDSIILNDRVKLDKLIYDVIDDKKTELKAKNISLKLSLESVEVPGNMELLNSSIANIVENAIKYNKEYGKIDIKSYKKANRGCISIKDTGIGMTDLEVENMFDAFYRVEANRVEGNGLGLSIVKNIIDEHSGDIEVYSKKGVGTEIVVSIPI